MNYFKDKNNEVFAFEDDAKKEIVDKIVKKLGLTEISEAQFNELIAPKIDDVKLSKIGEINTACEKEIVAGFKSDALGTSHNYQSEQIDQLNLIGVVTAGQDDYFKCGVEDADGNVVWNYEMHTIAQLQKVLQDGKAIAQGLLQKANTLKAQVANATTIDEVNAIQW